MAKPKATSLLLVPSVQVQLETAATKPSCRDDQAWTDSSKSSRSLSRVCRCLSAGGLQSLCYADLKILVTKVPRGASTSQASLSDSSTSADWL